MVEQKSGSEKKKKTKKMKKKKEPHGKIQAIVRKQQLERRCKMEIHGTSEWKAA